VAFAVGGIPEWLREGVNGHLAPGGLADAIVRTLADPSHYAELCAGARARGLEYGLTTHLVRLTPLFDDVIAS
jgi:glycosyltransferase involved in cell wall biosynthesis